MCEASEMTLMNRGNSINASKNFVTKQEKPTGVNNNAWPTFKDIVSIKPSKALKHDEAFNLYWILKETLIYK